MKGSIVSNITRNFDRVECRAEEPERLHIFSKDASFVSHTILNISQRGIRFISDIDLNTEGTYKVTLALPALKSELNCDGKVKYREPLDNKTCYGMELSISPSDEKMLADYIRSKAVGDLS